MKVSRILQSRHLMSKLFKPVNHENPNMKSDSKKMEEMLSKSHRMLVDYGFIQPAHNGAYVYLPLALKSLSKIEALVDDHLQKIDGQKILLPTMTDADLWKKSGRWNLMKDELFKLKNRHNHDFILAPTYEEAITHLLSSIGNISPKSLPLRLYQISSKYRDEMRCKFGLIRSKEFIMKDMYSFDKDINAAQDTYHQVQQVYEDFFKSLGVPFICVEGDTGAIGGSISHEYHFISDIGQDDLIICQSCGHGANVEIVQDPKQCSKCSSCDIERSKGIEVGHTFLLGDKYSTCFNAKLLTPEGKHLPVQMGCYGLGISRIMSASLEVLSNESDLNWPWLIAPFKVAILAAKEGSKEASSAGNNALLLYDQLNRHLPNDVILDDRGKLSVGKKLKEAKKSGFPYIILFGKESARDEPVIELFEPGDNEALKVPLHQVLNHLESQKCIL